MVTSLTMATATNEETDFAFDDVDHRSALLDNLNMLRRNRQFCDVILQISNHQNVHEIYAHKVVLSSASPYLLELFSSDPSPAVQQYKLLNGNYDIEAFERIVDYAYTGRLTIGADQVKHAYGIANRLQMTSVANQCGQHLLSTLTPDNCLTIRSISGVLNDPVLLQSVDTYIHNNMAVLVPNKSLDSLTRIHVEFMLNSDEERAVSRQNERNVFDMIVEWLRRSFEREELNSKSVSEKMHMLYLNNDDKQLHDCNDIADSESDAIQDYKQLMRRLSFPAKLSNGNSQVTNGNNGHEHQRKTSKSGRFLFTRSDSESSMTEELLEDDWKVLSTYSTGLNALLGLVIVSGKLFVLTVKLRVNSPTISPIDSRHNSLDRSEFYFVIPPMSSARCAVGAADLDGKLFVCGGYDRGECLNTVEIYDHMRNKWRKLRAMHVPRGRFDITVIDTMVYAVGGCDGLNDLNSVEAYDSEADLWRQMSNCPVVRSNAGVCNLNGEVYVIGGCNGLNRAMNRCDVFDPKTQHWFHVRPLITGRYQTGVAVLNGAVYAVGGCDSWTCLNSCEKYVYNEWREIARLSTARRGCGVTNYNGKIYAVGGHDGVSALKSVEIYDPIADQWTDGPPLTCRRANVGLASVGNRLYAVGGFNGKIFLNTIEYLDTETNEWTCSVWKDVNGIDACQSSESETLVETEIDH